MTGKNVLKAGEGPSFLGHLYLSLSYPGGNAAGMEGSIRTLSDVETVAAAVYRTATHVPDPGGDTIIHAPGGPDPFTVYGPDGYAVSPEAAPSRTVRIRSNPGLSSRVQAKRAAALGRVTDGDALSRCQAAARLTLRDPDRYSQDDRDDLSMDLYLKARDLSAGTEGASGAVTLTAKSVSMTRLSHWAANWRRSLDADRAHTEQVAADEAAESPTQLIAPAQRPDAFEPTDTDSQRERARVRATDMLAALGVPAEGPAFTAAYAAARAADGLEQQEATPELGLKPGTAKKAIQRVLPKLREQVGGDVAHWTALLLPLTIDSGGTERCSAGMDWHALRDAGIADDGRARLATDDTVTVRRTRKRAPWDVARTDRAPKLAPGRAIHWRHHLGARPARRLRTAAIMRQRRALAAAAAE